MNNVTITHAFASSAEAADFLNWLNLEIGNAPVVTQTVAAPAVVVEMDAEPVSAEYGCAYMTRIKGGCVINCTKRTSKQRTY